MPHLTEDEILRADHEHSERGMEPTQTALRAHLGYRRSLCHNQPGSARLAGGPARTRSALGDLRPGEGATSLGDRRRALEGGRRDRRHRQGGAAPRDRGAAGRKEAEAQEHEMVVKELEAELNIARGETERNEDT